MGKNIIIFIAKFIIAFALLYWLTTSGKLDFEFLKISLSNPIKVIIVIVLLLATHAISAFRWKIILENKSERSLSFASVFKANWIGIFFSTVLPGSVSGDVIKIFYIPKTNLSKKHLLGSILFDRVLGLFGLICIGSFFCLINYKKLLSLSPEMVSIIIINLMLLLSVIIFSISLFKLEKIPGKKFFSFKFAINIFIKIEKLWEELRMFKGHFFKLLFISIFIHICAVGIFGYIVLPFCPEQTSLMDLLSIVPVGFISLAIPIAPAGLGVGHAVFEKLMELINIDNGANLFNIYFIMVVFTNLTGIIPYLFAKKK